MRKVLKILVIAIGIFGFGVTKSVSQTKETKIAELFSGRTYVSMQKDTLHYRLLMPLDYDPNKQYPLVVCLSGGAGRGTDNIQQIAGSRAAQVLSTLENRKKYPAFIFVPQCPPGADWGRSLGKIETESLIARGRYNQPNVEALVLETISALEEEFNIDTTRRYITGQSMGGFGTWHYILSHPQMFAAAIPICGGGNPDLAKNIADVPLWVFHGDNDKTVPVDFSRRMVAALNKAGGNPKYNEFPGVGHGSWHLAFDTPALLDWFFAQVKEGAHQENSIKY
ncbi:prolyl oligopeptidase family serine peptidase [Arenibacter sp. BSSL-BM3]|uniref:Prolyl oligopeptidase family serine peptidase n=1 Tax=Arenibacter arenosicollis TaxID=2762274 RepID=A0ABR7QKR1_9FLAO|nr:prolyl oligopeptidase family serine peptidase [Arenibacter arenosicollis]MBC8767772.1 prolyl oligopeptidase family serine peptidase [Arenibacter arenosicollis]